MVSLERRFRGELVDPLESRSRARQHSQRDRAIELHDRRWCEFTQHAIKLHDAHPVSRVRCGGLRVTGGDGRLKGIGAQNAPLLLRVYFGTLESSEAPTYE